MIRVRRAYVDGRFGQLHLRQRRGERETGRALVCLHQSPKSGLEFEAFMRAAPLSRRVIAPDYPGYGMSDPPHSEGEATIETYAQEMWRIADALELERIDLFGNYTGGQVAAAMARMRPSSVGVIVMVSAALLSPEERRHLTNYFAPIALDRAGTRFRLSWERAVEHSDPALPLEALARSFMQNLMGGEKYEWGHAAAFANGAEFEAALAALPHHIFILNPTDQLSQATRRAASLLRNGRVIELPEWRHGFLDLHARAAADLVFGLLDVG
jgi:pimeloyl-ACP methyl ester carboxylesterase